MVWKKISVKPNRELWTKGDFRPAEGYEDWIHLDKIIGYGGKYEYEVGARRNINPNTINGHFKFFKTRTSAIKFVNSYLRKY